MGKYKPAEATVLSCERQDTIVYTTVDIETFDNKVFFQAIRVLQPHLFCAMKKRLLGILSYTKHFVLKRIEYLLFHILHLAICPPLGIHIFFNVGGVHINLRLHRAIHLIGKERNLVLLTPNGIMSTV